VWSIAKKREKSTIWVEKREKLIEEWNKINKQLKTENNLKNKQKLEKRLDKIKELLISKKVDNKKPKPWEVFEASDTEKINSNIE
jgi:alcohol dehydrogenase class IV